MIHLSLINRYFFRSTVKLIFYFTLIPTLIIWIVQSRQIFELGFGGGISFWVILKLSSLLIPPILPHILPFAILLAIIFWLVRCYNDSELSVLWAGGLTPSTLSRPFVLIGFFTTIIIFLLNIFVTPSLSRQLRTELFNAKNDLVRTILKPGIIQMPTKDVIVYINSIKGDSHIHGFYLHQKNPKTGSVIFTAKQALLREKQKNFELLLLQGRIVYWSENSGLNQQNQTQTKKEMFPTVLDFDKFSLNISDVLKASEKNSPLIFKAKDHTITELFSGKTAQTQEEKNKFKARGHEMIINSFYGFVMSGLAVFLLLYPLPPREFPYQLILKTVSLAVLIRVAGSGAQNLANEDINFIYLAYAIPMVSSVILWFAIFQRKHKKI